MDVEHAPLVQYPHRAIPAAMYRCDPCDAEYQWIKGQKLILIDKAV